MHSYASDSVDRSIVPWVLAVIAVGIAYSLSLGASALKVEFPWWAQAPSVMSVYGLLYYIYSHWGWRWSLWGVRFSQMPDCSGTWYGDATSTHGEGTSYQGMLSVHQTWTKIMLEFRTESSRSFSRMASLKVTPGPSQGLIYEYANDPNAMADAAMHAHRGFAFLRLSLDREWLEGEYYTGRDRASQGRLRLRRVSEGWEALAAAKAKHDELSEVQG